MTTPELFSRSTAHWPEDLVPWMTASNTKFITLYEEGIIFFTRASDFHLSKRLFHPLFYCPSLNIIMPFSSKSSVNFSFHYPLAKFSLFFLVLLSRSFVNTLQSTNSSIDLSGSPLQHFLNCGNWIFILWFVSCLLVTYRPMRRTWPFYLLSSCIFGSKIFKSVL